jgi:hypothetical protein
MPSVLRASLTCFAKIYEIERITFERTDFIILHFIYRMNRMSMSRRKSLILNNKHNKDLLADFKLMENKFLSIMNNRSTGNNDKVKVLTPFYNHLNP